MGVYVAHQQTKKPVKVSLLNSFRSERISGCMSGLGACRFQMTALAPCWRGSAMRPSWKGPSSSAARTGSCKWPSCWRRWTTSHWKTGKPLSSYHLPSIPANSDPNLLLLLLLLLLQSREVEFHWLPLLLLPPAAASVCVSVQLSCRPSLWHIMSRLVWQAANLLMKADNMSLVSIIPSAFSSPSVCVA